jgi:putative nucleotidyltransferase with HDIG domain
MSERQEPSLHPVLDTQITQTFEELKVNPQDRTSIENFLEPLRQKDIATYEHCVRVGFLAKRIGRFMHLDEKALFFAGLLHDLGKSEAPIETLSKTEGWTDADSQIVKQHVVDGYDAIKGRFDFTAEIIVLHHKFQDDGYPQILPPYLHDYSMGTQASIFEYARILALTDVYDALHRENDKFGEKRKLSGIEIKEKMLELNPDKRELIEDLYRAEILIQSEQVNIDELQTKRYAEVWEGEPEERRPRETARQVMLAAALEPIPEKTGSTTRSHDLSRHLKLEYFIAAGINIGEAFEDLVSRIDLSDTQPNLIYDLALKAQMDSVKNRAGGRVNQGIIELLIPIVASQHLFNKDNSLSSDEVLEKAKDVLDSTTIEDVENLRKMKRFAYDLSLYTDREIPDHPEAKNVLEYYEQDLANSNNPTSKAHNGEFIDGFPTVKMIYASLVNGSQGDRFSVRLENGYKQALLKHGNDVGKGFISDCCAAAIYLYISQNPKDRLII